MNEVTTEKLTSDFKALLCDVEELLKNTSSQAGESIADLRQRLGKKLEEGKAVLSEQEKAFREKAEEGRASVEAYVREKPWITVGIAAGIGLVLGRYCAAVTESSRDERLDASASSFHIIPADAVSAIRRLSQRLAEKSGKRPNAGLPGLTSPAAVSRRDSFGIDQGAGIFLNRAYNRYSSSEFEPGYLKLFRSGDLGERVRQAFRHMEKCDLCARYCHVNRLHTIDGAVCRTGEQAVVHSFGPHHGEEDVLKGRKGSGTIFFSWCNLRCVFCQNWEISHKGIGRPVEPKELAAMMLDLQERGCHNINFVSPSHVVAQILAAVEIAASEGLRLPLVYNTGGYDSLEALALLDGVIDIYMPDMKYGDSSVARQYSKVRNYVEANGMAVKEMHRQVGDLVLDESGLARRGLLIRHLVLPDNLAGTEKGLDFIAHEISSNTYINLMDQYHPCYRADEYPPLDRPITSLEYRAALAKAERHGLLRLDRRLAESA